MTNDVQHDLKMQVFLAEQVAKRKAEMQDGFNKNLRQATLNGKQKDSGNESAQFDVNNDDDLQEDEWEATWPFPWSIDLMKEKRCHPSSQTILIYQTRFDPVESINEIETKNSSIRPRALLFTF